jgi:hypothetical protein
MTNSDRITSVNETDGQKSMRRMALATIQPKKLIPYLIFEACCLTAAISALGTIAYSTLAILNNESPFATPQRAIYALVFAMPAAAVVACAKLLLDYRSRYQGGLRKAHMLKEIKQHEFEISHLNSDIYTIRGTVTRAGKKVDYSTGLHEDEMEAFEQL